jgi:hypothetical protein
MSRWVSIAALSLALVIGEGTMAMAQAKKEAAHRYGIGKTPTPAEIAGSVTRSH